MPNLAQQSPHRVPDAPVMPWSGGFLVLTIVLCVALVLRIILQ